MSFNLPAAALAGAIEEAGTAAEVAANKGDAPVNVFNELGEQGAVLLLRCDAAAACAFGWNWSRVRRLSGLKWTARPPQTPPPPPDRRVPAPPPPPPPHTHPVHGTALHCTADRKPSMANIAPDLHRARAVLRRLEEEVAKLQLHPGE